MTTIRVGMVGCGYMAKTHTIGYQNARLIYGDSQAQAELVRVSDVSVELASAGARRWGWAEATDDWQQITRAPDIDLVDIVTPNGAHADAAIDAARHGKHVICEKPLADSVGRALAMYEAVEAASVTHLVGFYYRMWPAIRFARQLIEDGKLGALRHFRGRFFQDYASQPEFPFSWRFDRELAGAGALGDIGSHIIDIARYLVGDLARVCAIQRTFVPERPEPGGGGPVRVTVDDLTTLLVEFADGTSGSIEASWAATGHKCDLGFELVGERGAVQFTWERANELRYYSQHDAQPEQGFRTILIGGTHPNAESFWFAPGQGLGYGDAFTIGIGEALAAVAERRRAAPNFLDGLRAAEIVEAAVRSIETGTWSEVQLHRGLGAA